MSLEKTKRVNQLLDLYEQLLTAKQKDIMTLYYRYDYSLSEIANELKVSRTAIFDMIKRTTKLLEKYESCVQMLQLKEALWKVLPSLTKQDQKQIRAILERDD